MKIYIFFKLIKMKITNRHTIYVESGVSNREQLENSVKEAIYEMGEKLGRRIRCKFQVNLVIGKNNQYFGIGYIWVSNPEVYNILLSLEENGEKRCVEIEDPTWKPLSIEEENKLKYDIDELDWNELTELENRKKGCPIIKEYLPPIVSLPGYKYTEEQKQHLSKIPNKPSLSFRLAAVTKAFIISP